MEFVNSRSTQHTRACRETQGAPQEGWRGGRAEAEAAASQAEETWAPREVAGRSRAEAQGGSAP